MVSTAVCSVGGRVGLWFRGKVAVKRGRCEMRSTTFSTYGKRQPVVCPSTSAVGHRICPPLALPHWQTSCVCLTPLLSIEALFLSPCYFLVPPFLPTLKTALLLFFLPPAPRSCTRQKAALQATARWHHVFHILVTPSCFLSNT
jgi:hypothetical protein